MSARFPHLPAEAWSALLEDRLDGPAELRLRAHLSECLACRSILAAADPTRTFGALSQVVVRPEAVADLWQGVAAELGCELARPPRRDGSARRAFLAGVAAALVIAAAVGFDASRGPRDTSPGSPSGAQAPPCPPELASLRLTREECRALRLGGPIASDDPAVVLVVPDLDLRGL